MLIYLYHSKTLVIILIDNCLDTCRLARSAVTKQQTVICFSSVNKGFSVINKLLFLYFISNKIIKLNLVHIVYCIESYVSIGFTADSESFVKSKHTNAVIFVKGSYKIKELLVCFSRCKTFAQDLHFFTYIMVIHKFLLTYCLIMCKNSKAVNSQFPLNL